MAEHSFGRANQKFTVADWRALFGAEPGIVGDVDGSAYKLTLPTGTDDAVLGSTTQDSTSVVGGALHQIAAGQTQTVTIPASTNAAAGRTDLIVVRYDAATYTTDPGPCRLYRVAGVEGSTALPTLDEAPPGVEDMPLWAVTRKQGQSLNQAASRWLGRRTGPNLLVPSGESLPADVPLGTRAERGGIEYVRDLNSSGTPAWRPAGMQASYAPSGAALTQILAPSAPVVGIHSRLVIKTGRATCTTSSSGGHEYADRIVFDEPFPTACLSVQATQYMGPTVGFGPAAAYQGGVAIDSMSRTDFRLVYPGSTTSTIRSYSWLAVGY